MNYTKMVKKINYNNKKNKKVYYLLPKGKTKYSHDRSLCNELYSMNHLQDGIELLVRSKQIRDLCTQSIRNKSASDLSNSNTTAILMA